ncbi:MAG: hypothetical protein JW929_01425 [Anaerolineales bacterium]|nr:hypothetical protein [Anaerolineales bacterium]
MGKSGRILLGTYILALILPACGGAGVGGVTVVRTTKPSVTYKPSATETHTYTPSITPTATKIPDLEIVDGRLIDWSDTVGGVYFMGRLRNNTDTPMVLPVDEYAFIFQFEKYRTFGDIFLHDTIGPYGLKPLIMDLPRSNCILYPKEEGVILFDWSSFEEMDGFLANREEVKKYTGPLGMTFSYQSFYIPSMDLLEKYHPKAENVEYHVEGATIYFEFDIYIPAPQEKKKGKNNVFGYLMMFDKDGEMINMLYENIWYDLPYNNPYDNLVHLEGHGSGEGVMYGWRHLLTITKEDLNKVDHIEMFFESQFDSVCMNVQ